MLRRTLLCAFLLAVGVGTAHCAVASTDLPAPDSSVVRSVSPRTAPVTTTASIQFTSGTDITAALQSAVNAGQGGIHAYAGVITLPAGMFTLSAAVNLHGSVLEGAGTNQTYLTISHDLGTGGVGLTGDVSNPYGPYVIQDLTLQGPRPTAAVADGVLPNQMDGIHLYDNDVLRRVNINYFNRGVIIDGNHHTLDTVAAQNDYDGVAYIVSSDGTYFDDYFDDCSFTANTCAGISIANSAQMGGCTVMRTHLGFEPYGILMGQNSTLGSCAFIQMQFEGVGNGDICDTNYTSNITNNYFTNCSGWGGRYNNAIAGQPTAPSLRCGTFASNVIAATSAMGPTPGDLCAAEGFYSNSWTCDQTLVTSLQSGQLTPPTTTNPANVYGDEISAQGMQISLNAVTRTVSLDEAVELDGGRYQGVVPASGHGIVYGVSLASVPAGSIAWIAQHGRVSLSCPQSPVITPGQWLEVDPTTGLAVPAASQSGGEIIGYATSSSYNGSVPAQIAL